MTRPTISVALCTHNGAAFVVEQVESILAQSVPATQIVLSDDASTDGTVALVERAVREWPAPKPDLVVLRNARQKAIPPQAVWLGDSGVPFSPRAVP